jgi:hypothetical protein
LDNRPEESGRAEARNGLLAFAVSVFAFASLEALVAGQVYAAYRDQFLTVSQMQARGFAQGLPFLWHFGMWGDALLVSPLAAFLSGRYFRQWRLPDLWSSALVGAASSFVLSWLFTLGDMPEAHVIDHQLTMTGYIHLAYMAIVIALFTQFFFFTARVRASTLRVVSVLLVIHVLVGTHMALGALQLVSPRAWYSAQPLKSVTGWLLVAMFAVALAWYNFATAAMQGAMKRLIGRIHAFTVDVWMFTGGKDPESDEGLMRLLDFGCSTLAAAWFLKIAYVEWTGGDDPFMLALTLLVGFKFYFSRLSVTQELQIGKTLYPREIAPEYLLPRTRADITRQVISFMMLYFLLGWTTQYIAAASALLTVIAVIDFNTRRQINQNILRSFDDPDYAPLEGEWNYQLILDRRDVIRGDLTDRHLWKEAGNTLGTGAALVVGVWGFLTPGDVRAVAYVALIGTQAINEVITQRWRWQRFQALRKVDRAFQGDRALDDRGEAPALDRDARAASSPHT